MEVIFNTIIKAAGWSIIHSLWQGAVLYIILLLLFISVPALTSRARHNLAFMTLCSTFAWFILTFYNEFIQAYASERFMAGSYPAGSISFSHSIIELPLSFVSGAERGLPWVVGFYSIGLAVQTVLLISGYHRVQQIRRIGLTDIPETLNIQFTRIASRMGINRKIAFKFSSLVSVPLVVGYFRPVVLLPLSILTRMSPEGLEAIIIHELSHIRRNDYLLNFLKITIETILFFNPFVWLSGKLIDTERENACDDLVLQITGKPLVYAHTLLELEKIKSGGEIFSMAATGKKYHLLNRIQRITNMKASNLNLKLQLLTIVVLITAVFSLAWIPATAEKAIVRDKVVKAATVVRSAIDNLMNTGQKPVLKDKKAPLISLRSYVLARVNAKTLTDTTRSKGKFKIVVEDENGVKKEYNNLDELPEEMRTAFLKENRTGVYPTQVYYDLLKKMEGVKVDKDGKILVGEQPVTRIKVDGKDVYDFDAVTIYKDGIISPAGKPVTKITIDSNNIYTSKPFGVVNLTAANGKDNTEIVVHGKPITDSRTLQNTLSAQQMEQIQRIDVQKRPFQTESKDAETIIFTLNQSALQNQLLKQSEKLRKLPEEDRNRIIEELRKDIEKQQAESLEFKKQQEEFLKATEKMKDLQAADRIKLMLDLNRKIEEASRLLENKKEPTRGNTK